MRHQLLSLPWVRENSKSCRLMPIGIKWTYRICRDVVRACRRTGSKSYIVPWVTPVLLCCPQVWQSHLSSGCRHYAVQANSSPERWLDKGGHLNTITCLSNHYTIYHKVVAIWVTCWVPVMFQARSSVLLTQPWAGWLEPFPLSVRAEAT